MLPVGGVIGIPVDEPLAQHTAHHGRTHTTVGQTRRGESAQRVLERRIKEMTRIGPSPQTTLLDWQPLANIKTSETLKIRFATTPRVNVKKVKAKRRYEHFIGKNKVKVHSKVLSTRGRQAGQAR